MEEYQELRRLPNVKRYFYRVSEYVTTFKADKGKNDSITHSEEFKGEDLLEEREKALWYYEEREEGLLKTSYFLPFASPDEFVKGENSAYSLDLIFVEEYEDGTEEEYYLLGHSEEDTEEAEEFEKKILSEMYPEEF